LSYLWHTSCFIIRKIDIHIIQGDIKMVALFVVLTFVVFLVADYFILKAQRKTHPAFSAKPVFDKGSFLLPEGFSLTRNHLWLKGVKNGRFQVGIDEFVKKAFGSVRIQNIATENSKVNVGDLLFEAVSGNHKLQFFSPIEGEITQVNKNLESKKVTDPYDEDWSLVINPSESGKFDFYSGRQGMNWLKNEFTRFKDFLAHQTTEPGVVGVTYADGGNIMEGVLNSFDEKTLNGFQKEFLSL